MSRRRRCPDGRPCFICHEPILASQAATRGHVLPKCFFPQAFRNQPGVDLLPRVWAHTACDTAYSEDEEYLRHSLSLLSAGRPIWDLMREDLRASLARPESRALFERVRSEFGRVIDTETGLTTKSVDWRAFQRVFTKVLRALVASLVEPKHWVPLDASFRFELEAGPTLKLLSPEMVGAFFATECLWPRLAPVADVRWVDGLPRGHMFVLGLWGSVLVIGTIETPEGEAFLASTGSL